MLDSPKFAKKNEEEIEDFHDYEDEEHSEQDSKLDDYDDAQNVYSNMTMTDAVLAELAKE